MNKAYPIPTPIVKGFMRKFQEVAKIGDIRRGDGYNGKKPEPLRGMHYQEVYGAFRKAYRIIPVRSRGQEGLCVLWG